MKRRAAKRILRFFLDFYKIVLLIKNGLEGGGVFDHSLNPPLNDFFKFKLSYLRFIFFEARAVFYE